VQVWDVQTGDPAGWTARVPASAGTDSIVQYLDFSDDGQLLVSSAGMYAQIWDVTNGGARRLLTVGKTARVHELLPATPIEGAALADLAEAISGEQVTSQGFVEILPFGDRQSRLQKLRAQFSIPDSEPVLPWFLRRMFAK
jgi:hypothetical protein